MRPRAHGRGRVDWLPRQLHQGPNDGVESRPRLWPQGPHVAKDDSHIEARLDLARRAEGGEVALPTIATANA